MHLWTASTDHTTFSQFVKQFEDRVIENPEFYRQEILGFIKQTNNDLNRKLPNGKSVYADTIHDALKKDFDAEYAKNYLGPLCNEHCTGKKVNIKYECHLGPPEANGLEAKGTISVAPCGTSPVA